MGTGLITLINRLILIAAFLCSTSASAEQVIKLASTTSTENSGLFKFLLPKFEKATKIKVRVIAAGTGQAIRIGRNGDADVLIVHHPPSEERFVAEGFGLKRHKLMYNDLVIVGPKTDSAKIGGVEEATIAFSKIASSMQLFASRGDESGTHLAEKEIWKRAQLNPQRTRWYLSLGAGMGSTLNIAVAMDTYALTDRASWAAFKNKKNHTILMEGDKKLFNQYSVIAINKKKHGHVKFDLVKKFTNWLLSNDGQKAIRNFRINGKQVFFPNANREQ